MKTPTPRILFPLLCMATLTLLGLPAHSQTEIQTEPHGYIKVSIAPGTGVSKRITLLSIPLLDETVIEGRAAGKITGVTKRTLTSTPAGWTPGQLSNPDEPYLIEITSGPLRGRMMLISTSTPNTSDTLTLAQSETIDLETSGISISPENGDTYRIRPVDTLLSFFGTPDQTPIQGGVSPASADTITMVVNGSASTYFYNTSPSHSRWSRVAVGSPSANNVPIPPSASLQYARLAPTPLELVVTGRVPVGPRQVLVKNSGVTLMSSHWPINQTLVEFGLQNVPNWKKGGGASSADTVVLVSGGAASTHFYDGKNWRRVSVGSPISDAMRLPFGSGAMIIRKGLETGQTPYEKAPPYSLE